MKWRFGKPAMWLVLAGLAALATPMAAQRRRPNRPPPVDLPKGPVRQIILRNCTACHGIDDYAFFALDRAGWQSLLETKHKSGGAVLPDQDRTLSSIISYLNSARIRSHSSRPRARAAPRPLRTTTKSSVQPAPTLQPEKFWIPPAPHVTRWNKCMPRGIPKRSGARLSQK